ncbi:MAG: DUF1343 domain-containing protein [Muribaculaceae bacterium]|nr:DUF1343 domain-containing protein [Muribaculaceae bacterium]
MKRFSLLTLFCAIVLSALAQRVQVGAERIGEYADLLSGKRVALYSNHTGVVPDGKGGMRHTLDLMLDHGIDVRCIFSPEHGFRGTADAGEHVSSSVDPATGIPIVSLYGSGHKAAMESALDSIDVIVTDIQDVGLRYYTYYCTMLELMDASAERGQKFVVLDRPNPNGMYVDGPILDMRYESGVGRLPIPVVHGLTLGEMARMANGEGWLKSGKKADLSVVPCLGYTHQTRYRLPVAPSPNLPNMTAVYLYPSLCYFEATPVSLGRGTDKPFQIYGHPTMKGRKFSFTPESRPGAQKPPQMGKLCHGEDLSTLSDEEIIAGGINLAYLIDAYGDVGGEKFFSSFFEKLIGRGDIRQMIASGRTADEIKATWAPDVAAFKTLRRPYLLYSE